jgi:formamidopyrimidine-DNA glycosylase
MPELPEAEVVARRIRDRLLGAVLKDCWIGRPDIVRQGLSSLDWYRGATLTEIARMGKSVVFSCTRDGDTRAIVAELGMTGLLLFRAPNESYLKHTHALFSFSGGKEAELRYWNPRRFGRLYLLDQVGLGRFRAKRFGRDPLTVSWEHFQQLVGARRGRLKALLMHQQTIAGIGNIYANEILFRARLHPYRLANRLRPATVRRLYDAIQTVLRDAITDGGSSIRDFIAPDGTKGCYQDRHQVYDQAGRLCSYGCGQTIRWLAGERSSFYCPRCQPKRKMAVAL